METARADEPGTVRPATAQDLDGILALADSQRRRYGDYRPLFWRPAADALEQQRRYLGGQLQRRDVLARVADSGGTIVGFSIGRLTPAPPVYAPGGATCLIDDFAVAQPDLWASVGVQLLHSVRAAAKEQGAVQIVVVTAHLDAPKRAALTAAGLGIASEWWTGPVGTD